MSTIFQLRFGLRLMSPTQFLIPQELGWIQVSMELSYLHTFQEVAYIPDEQNCQRKTWFAEYLHLFYDRFCPLNQEQWGK